MDKYKEFVKIKHGTQTRIQGTPYYLHPFEVAEIIKEKGFSKDYLVVALFHDLLEDTDTTDEEILKLSNESVLLAVKLLTKEDGYNMEDYINRISRNPMAKVVKLADRLHNLKESKFASRDFRTKYIAETIEWYLPMSQNTLFENDIKEALSNLIKNLDSECV